MNKYFKCKVPFLILLVIVLLPSMGCNGEVEQVPEPEEEEKTVKTVGSIAPGKQRYRPYETFSTIGDRLFVFYTDGTNGYINSGFTEEYILCDHGAWYDDPDCENEFAPIHHGDPLPVHVTSTSPMMSFDFNVRGVYKGFAGTSGFRSVSWGY